MAYSSFTKKALRTTFVLGQGTFSNGGNTLAVQGLATDVRIEKSGMPMKNSADISITGLSLPDMEQLTTLAFRLGEPYRNSITVEAGEEGGALSTVFYGEVSQATADFNTAPDVVMRFEAITGLYGAMLPRGATSIEGDAKAEELVEKFAREAGYTYKDEGVTAKVKNAVFVGSPTDKMQAVAEQVGLHLIIDDGVVTLAEHGTARPGTAPTLSAASGLLGYPTFTDTGIACKTLFNPNVRYGGSVTLDTIVPRASGTWVVTQIIHNLSAYHSSGGAWNTEIRGIQAIGSV